MVPPAASEAPTPAAAPGLEPIIGGTLALLTHYARMPDLKVSERIACNLALIARHPEATATLRSMCTHLFVAWLGPLDVQDGAVGGEWRDVWPMPPAMQ